MFQSFHCSFLEHFFSDIFASTYTHEIVPHQGFNVSLSCWQISYSAVAVVSSALEREVHVVESLSIPL